MLLAAGVAGGGATWAVASVPDSSGVIHACVALQPGSTLPVTTGANLRVIDSNAGQSCSTGNPAGGPPGEATLDFNQQGPQGVPGQRGATGPSGHTLTISGQTFTLNNGRSITIAGIPAIAPLAVNPNAPPVGTLTLKGKQPSKPVQVLSFSFGASNAGSKATGGGGGAGKVKFNEFSITRRVDKASPKLFQACATGEHISKALLYIRKAGGSPAATYTLSDVTCSAYQSAGENPTESLSFNFTKLTVKYPNQ